MFNKIEDYRNEFKEVLNEKLEKEIISFLNSSGGNLYIGIKNNGEIIGIEENIDKIQLEIKDRIKNNIRPITLGLFDIKVLSFDGKVIIHVCVANGVEKPYYLKKKGMIPEGCFVRVGSSVESMNQEQIEDLFSKRTRNSLINIKSPLQDLTFRQLRIYYEEKGFTVNDNFFKQLNLIKEDGKYNYLAYLLADNNNVSIKVATYEGNDAYNLIENEEYGFCSIVKATEKVIDKFESINKTFTKITGSRRKELKMFDKVAIREAIVNAFVHNRWEVENPPKFEIFNDHISITSTGGLPIEISEEEFLKGYSFPKHPELMRVFKDLDLVEQLGTGIIRILKAYDKNVYEFSDNFIKVNFKFKDYKMLENSLNKENNLTKNQDLIIDYINENEKITQKELVEKTGMGRSTIKNNINILKDNGYLIRKGSDKNGYWKIIK